VTAHAVASEVKYDDRGEEEANNHHDELPPRGMGFGSSNAVIKRESLATCILAPLTGLFTRNVKFADSRTATRPD
jgi:hypothetical protein